ncbi:malonate--CoA ligase ACSF3, mitochondrial-like [Liolophura sinensis]|uniref:malonate--CoA ligase ACSF3, mitochondrial-like n=1 Tax=Liolophura sinensis TaxID=3198878 RepID=UPI003158674D
MMLHGSKRMCGYQEMCLNILRLLKCDRPHRLVQPSACLIWGFHGNQRGYSRPVYSTKRQNLVTPVFLRAENFLSKTALIDCHKVFSYADLLHYSAVLSKEVQQLYGREHLTSDRVALLCGNDGSYVIGQWSVWMAGGVVVPLCKTHPVSELEYFVTDSQCSSIIVSEEFTNIGKELAQRTNIPIKVLSTASISSGYLPADNEWFQTDVVVKKVRRLRLKNRFDDLLMNNSYKRIPAMIVYTSGTTGRPKGVVLTFGNVYSAVESMIHAWEWRASDVILHVLPLHHTHGIINTLVTPLHCGATCIMLPKFDANMVWSRLLNPVAGNNSQRINLFMAVPTVYAKLIENYDTRINRGRGSRWMKEYVRSSCMSRIRLMVSGSAALPQPIMDRWEEITGHRLLERYGMTEIGMALSNPLHGPRVPGSVGTPMPGVEVCIARNNVYAEYGYDVITRGNTRGSHTIPGFEGEQGELLVKGSGVFKEYYNRPEETQAAFSKDGWFKTGDTAVFEKGVYRIIGRTSVDVIKSGGYKISALDVERHLLAHPNIIDCAVVGLPDITWGQRVALVVVFRDDTVISLESIREWAKDKMAAYQIPTVMKVLPAMPRSPIGKVNKKELLKELFPNEMKRVI